MLFRVQRADSPHGALEPSGKGRGTLEVLNCRRNLSVARGSVAVLGSSVDFEADGHVLFDLPQEPRDVQMQNPQGSLLGARTRLVARDEFHRLRSSPREHDARPTGVVWRSASEEPQLPLGGHGPDPFLHLPPHGHASLSGLLSEAEWPSRALFCDGFGEIRRLLNACAMSHRRAVLRAVKLQRHRLARALPLERLREELIAKTNRP